MHILPPSIVPDPVDPHSSLSHLTQLRSTMPITTLLPNQVAKWGPGLDSDATPTSSHSPIYSGHLLKLGTNDRWQSRLFTFDGSVLTCVGKRARTPPIVTYDPHVSSPFVQPAYPPPPKNANTKWSIDLTTVSEIRLLPSSRTFRCFPYTDTSTRSLIIQTTDGRTLNLRAKKDIELERWYFVLSKIWGYQHRASIIADRTETADQTHSSSQLVAHQQSFHLYSKYLQKQKTQNSSPTLGDQQDPPRALRQGQAARHLQHLQAPKAKARESFLRYQIPAPPRVSAFLPPGFDWSLQGQDEDEEMSGHGAQQGGHTIDSDRMLHRQNSYQEPSVSIRPAELVRSQSVTSGVVQPQFPWSGAGNMEPAKAAAIDIWRRSLMSPPLMEETISIHSDDPDNQTLARVKSTRTPHTPDEECDSGMLDDLEVGHVGPLKDAVEPRVRSKWYIPKSEYIQPRAPPKTVSSDDSSLVENPVRPILGSQQRSSSEEDNLPLAVIHHEREARSTQNAVKDLAVQPKRTISRQHENIPSSVLQERRLSQWQNTQISSEDGASGHRLSNMSMENVLLPPQPITPKRNPTQADDAKAGIDQPRILKRPSLKVPQTANSSAKRMTPSLSNPSLSLHGSSYSYLPIHDLEFVFPRHKLSPRNENPASGESEEVPSIPDPSSSSMSSVAAKTPPVRPAMDLPRSISADILPRPYLPVHTASRLPRRCPSIPSSSKICANPSTKYISIDTSLYKASALSTSTQSLMPPSRPTQQKASLEPKASQSAFPLSASSSLGAIDQRASPSKSALTSPAIPVDACAFPTQTETALGYQGIKPMVSKVAPVPPLSPGRPLMHRTKPTGSPLAPERMAQEAEDDDDDRPLAQTRSRQQTLRQQQPQSFA